MGITDIPGVVDVSKEFDQVISMFFVQSVTGSFIGFYHVLSIFVFPVLLKFSYPIGIFNKLNLAFGAGCMVFMHLVRYSHSGKVCSGDYLSLEAINYKGGEIEGYLVIRGKLMAWYIGAFWTVLALIIVSTIMLIVAAIKSF